MKQKDIRGCYNGVGMLQCGSFGANCEVVIIAMKIGEEVAEKCDEICLCCGNSSVIREQDREKAGEM